MHITARREIVLPVQFAEIKKIYNLGDCFWVVFWEADDFQFAFGKSTNLETDLEKFDRGKDLLVCSDDLLTCSDLEIDDG